MAMTRPKSCTSGPRRRGVWSAPGRLIGGVALSTSTSCTISGNDVGYPSTARSKLRQSATGAVTTRAAVPWNSFTTYRN